MNNAGLMRIGAMLAMLAVLTGAFAALPYWNARATDRTIWGLVDECNPASPGPSFLSDVVVSLIDAHGLRPTVNTSTSFGYYTFTPPTGSYELKFTVAEHYYNKSAYPIRFDGSRDLNINACLYRMPARTQSLTVLVVDQTSAAHLAEQLDNRFVRIPFSENIAGTVNTGTGLATVSYHPVVRPGYSVTWRDPPAGTVPLSEPSGYNWPNLFNGTIQITDATVLASLNAGRGGKWLNVSYQYSATSVRLLYSPVVPGSYLLRKNGASWMAAENTDWKLDVDTGTLTILQNFVFGTDNLFIDYSSTGAVPNASVNLYNTTAKQEVAQGLTSGSGFFTFSIWGASLQLRASKEQYQPTEVTVDTRLVNTTRVVLPNAVQVFGIAYRSDRTGVVNTNVVGFLYNRAGVSDFKKLVAAKVSGALYQFYAEANQNYRMVIDADGYKAVETLVTTPASGAIRVDSYLTPSLKEEYRTVITYHTVDWSRVNISRSLILRPDSTIPGLDLPGIRSLGLQIDYGLGNRDGVLQTSELNGANGTFQWWLQTRLADYVTTDSFLTTNGLVYNSSATYTVTPITYSPSLANPIAFFVNTTASYMLKTPPVLVNGKPTYLVNITTPNDSNETVYQDQVVEVRLPLGYEMTQKKVTGPITTTGWTRVTVDPGLGAGSSEIDMTIQRSRNGTARAMVAGPSGKFFVLDDTLQNYTTVVAANTNITFSAEQSTDPVGNIRDANFTWHFTNNTDRVSPRRIGYNITSTFNYSTAVLASVPPPGHFFVVNLTVTEAGGNLTYRDIKVWVDDTPPVARIKTNRTGAGNANDTLYKINEDIPIKFDGSLSTDVAFAGAPTWLNNHKSSIPDIEGRRGYQWDFEGKHIVSSNLKAPVHAFDTPGRYNTTLRVMDWVGHNSTVNATLHLTVNDTTKPTPNFIILDPSKDWTVTTTLIEGKNYSFNASTSKDNYDETRNLSYAWHFPGPVNCTPACAAGNITPRKGYIDGVTWGWNVTVWWSEFNVSYNVTLNVTDTGFLGRTPNYANLTSAVHVSVDTAKHPDLKYVGQSLKIEPNQVEEGQLINVSFMISNEVNRANATAVTITLTAKDANGAVVLVATNPEWRDSLWKPVLNHTIATGAKVRIIFTISFPAQGNKSLDIRFYDAREPYTWVGENRVTGSVFVKLAGWVIPAAIGGFIAVVIGVAYGARLYSRYRSGELVFRRKEKKEKKKLEDKDEDEEPEPEEDTKGKKRL